MARYLELALNLPLPQTFTYLNCADGGGSAVGKRADIMFGNRRTKGVVVAESDELPEGLGFDAAKIRPIKKFIDEEPVLTPELLELARWLSQFYLCSLGEAIGVMLPGGKRESELGGFGFADDIAGASGAELSDEQRRAVSEIRAQKGQILHYLYGATGTGKTEVFLQLASETLAAGTGVLYLVPEISLTQQVVEAVVARFGKTAAVLHSALTPSQKLAEWHRILRREARVVVGARSAVFAPIPELGLIIIDEEHDGSYKSGATPRYHARQVAMHRCMAHRIPLVMGSATPSVEAWNMMESGRIARHTLTRRLAGGAPPTIRAVNLSDFPADTGCISPPLQEEISGALRAGRQAILFLNRRGFTHFFRCNSCGFELTCKNCSVAMTFHKNEKRLRCHYCGWSTEPPQQCPECGSLDVGYSGFGTEFIEGEVRAKFPHARVVRLDTDALTKKGELQEKIDSFRRGDYDILLGTQMVAKGLNFPNLRLVGVVLADTGLHLPDFRAAERTFALITQVAGRAGRFFPDGTVIVQTYAPDREPVARAVRGETELFYAHELETRKMLGFPPFSRLVRLVFRAASAHAAERAAREAAGIFARALDGVRRTGGEAARAQAGGTDILGPAECAIAKISMNYRWQVLLRGPSVALLQHLARTLLTGYKAPADVYIECDVDPVSLL